MKTKQTIKTDQAVSYFSSSDEVESAFYSAFEMGDGQLMSTVLADKDVSCIHPKSVVIVGREAVLNSWMYIASHYNDPEISFDVIKKVVSDDLAIHLVVEEISVEHQSDSEAQFVLSTNIYIRQKNGWRLMVHHASLPDQQNIEREVEIEKFAFTHKGSHTLQ